jgi:hypothetical protein
MPKRLNKDTIHEIRLAAEFGYNEAERGSTFQQMLVKLGLLYDLENPTTGASSSNRVTKFEEVKR